MKIFRLSLIVIVAWFAPSFSPQVIAQNPDLQTPTRFSLRTLAPYLPSRIGYDSLPVQIGSAGGGKLGPNEKFKIMVSLLKNRTEKNIKAVKFSCFIFRSGDLDHVVETTQSSLILVELLAFERRKVDILIGYVDEIPLLIYKPGQEFHMEIAVTEAHYDDGSIWQATDLPQKLDPTKNP
jgi:hypothetical protein